MDKIADMHRLIESEDIHIEVTCRLPVNINGFYLRRPGLRPGIAISRKIVGCPALYAATLAEELGHHFTSHGNATVLFNSYSDRLALSKAEEKALRWATEYLLPLDAIQTGFCGFRSIAQTADDLCVTVPFLMARLEYLSRKTSHLPLTNGTSLMLMHYPSIYIYHNLNGLRADI